ncbi:MAG: T9SS type A sorting domain-containing protein [Melioribacteraceae bacterium]|nr:MAG: T9SS type A sorting domain-containing protein [Melioribacteraceae bacterium]
MKKIKYIISLIILIQLQTMGQFETWNVIGEMTNPVSRGQAVVYKDRIYIFGGFSDITQTPVNWIQEYNPSTGVWRQVGKMNAAREGFLASVQDTSILLFGGVENNSNLLYTIEEWTPNIPDSTARIIGFNENFDRVYPTGLSFNNEVYIFGGYPFSNNTQNLTYFTQYRHSDNSFNNSANFIYSASNFPNQQMSAIFTTSIYIFGGVQSGILKTIYEYKTTTKQHTKLSIQLNEPRAGGIAIKHQLYKLIYIIGGFDEGSGSLASVEIFRPADEGGAALLLEGPKLNYKRKNLMAVYYDKTFYVFGGEDSNGKLVPYVERLDPQLTTIADEQNKIPSTFSLSQNYPNPFNPTTVIKYQIPEYSFVNLKIFDILGNEVIELVNENKHTGYYEVHFNAKDLTSGVYFYRLTAGKFSETKKMVVVK